MKKNKIGVLLISMAILLQNTVFAEAVQQPTVALDSHNLPEWGTTISPYGGKLLLSDSPEIVPADGIMYQDTVNGDNRLFFHHVNGTSTPKKVIVLLENATEKPANVTVYQYGLGGPGYDYLEVGKKVQRDYIEGKDVYLLEVPAKGSSSLIPTLDHDVVQPNMLVNGMYDFVTDQPVKVKVMMMPVDADVNSFATTANVLPADVGQYRLRGTFEGKDRLVISDHIYDVTKDGAVAMTLADNDLDTYVTGTDATDGTATTNYGNYGVVYKIHVPSTSNGKMSYYLNPLGGEYAGWLGTKYRHQEVSTIATPADKNFFGKPSGESAYIGTYEGGKSLWLTFSPPGASNLPIKFIIKPSK